jgi:hypothetical protein
MLVIRMGNPNGSQVGLPVVNNLERALPQTLAQIRQHPQNVVVLLHARQFVGKSHPVPVQEFRLSNAGPLFRIRLFL